MLSHLYELSGEFPAFRVLQYAEFRAAAAALFAFIVALVFGRWWISYLLRCEVLERAEKGDSERLRELHRHKARTPTMGGVILLVAVVASVVLCARLDSRLVQLLLGVTLAFGGVGFVDDLIKLRSQRKGLSASTKLRFQVLLAALAGCYLYFYPLEVQLPPQIDSVSLAEGSVATTVFFPFFKNLHISLGVAYILLVVLVTVGTSNAVNLTDGLDGLAVGCSVLVGVTFVVVAFLAGYEGSSGYLMIPHVLGGTEVAVFAAALVGAGMGFLWFNCHPAQIFMGDTGALALGGALGLIAILSKQEILLLFVGGVLVAEASSVILQVTSYKLRRKRIFLIAPLHHHYQFKGWTETKVTLRFWIAGAILAVLTLVTLRIA